MIAALRGEIVRWDDENATLWLDVGGVTYELIIPRFAGEWVGQHPVGAELQLYTYYHVSERNPQPLIIGFPRLAEREFFRTFIEVPDIGPVKAVKALTYPISEIARWVETEDAAALQQLPGIGTRLAQTIVARLRGRLLEAALLRDEAGAAALETPATDLRADAVEALEVLQYSRREARRAVEDALLATPELESLEDLLRAILEQRAPAR